MKLFKPLILGAVVLLASSCSSTVTFPVSESTPAAIITAKKTKSDNDNQVIEVTARNLAAADRLSPAKKTYVVWLVTDKGTRNAGQLSIKNAKKSTFLTSTPFKVKEVFITAEDDADTTKPSSQEITRTDL